MSLTSHLGDPASPVLAFMRERFPHTRPVVGALNNDMMGWSNDQRLDNTIRYSNPGIRDVQPERQMPALLRHKSRDGSVQLGDGDVRRLARGVLESAHDVGLAFDAH